MGVIFNIPKLIIEKLADLEFKVIPNKTFVRNQFWRKIHLRLMRVRFGDFFYIGHLLYIRNRGNLILGERCCIGSFAKIYNYATIEIRDDFISASGLCLNSGGHDTTTLKPTAKGIKIGNRVWCGVNVTILDGVTIGDDVVIGAGSLVVNDISDNSVVVGVPARKVKNIDRTGVKMWAIFPE